MKSNLFKKATALGVVATMVLSTNVFATVPTPPPSKDLTDIGMQRVEGAGTVVAPVYRIKVPTAISFAVDPYELGAPATGSALNPRTAIKVPGFGYAISNQSNIAIAVDVEATLTPVAGVFVVPSNGAINTPTTLSDASLKPIPGSYKPLDPTNIDKEISLFMLIAKPGAKVVTMGALMGQPMFGTTYAALGAIEVSTADAGKKPARVRFVLDKGLVGTDGKPVTPAKINEAAATGFGAFSFQGDVNALASWSNNDVKINVKYNFAPMPDIDKAAVTYDTTNRQAVPLVGGAFSAENVALKLSKPVLQAIGPFSKAAPSDMTLSITNAGDGYKTVSMTTGSTPIAVKIGTLALAASDFTVAQDGTVLIKGATLATTNKLKALSDGTYTVEWTTKNGRTAKVDLVVAP